MAEDNIGDYMQTFTSDYKSNLHMINETLRVGESFDITVKHLKIGGRKATFYCLNGFVKDEMFEKELEYLSKLTREDMENIKDADDFLNTYITYIQCKTENDFE